MMGEVLVFTGEDVAKFFEATENRIREIAEVSRRTGNFLFTESDISALCDPRVLADVFPIFAVISSEQSKEIALDLIIHKFLKEQCNDYRIFCNVRDNSSRDTRKRLLPKRFC